MRKLALICIPVSGLLFSSCLDDRAAGALSLKPASHQVPVIPVSRQDIDMDKLYVSDIQAIKNVEIRSRIQGFLEKVHVDEGALVKKGQLLFSINDQELRADVSKAKASLNSISAEAKTAELEVARVKLLVDKKIVTATELDVAKAKQNAMQARIEEAEAALSHAQTLLSYTQIRAPYDGVIDRIPLKVGSLLEEGTLITSVSDISSVYAYFNISENEYLAHCRAKAAKGYQEENAVQLILSDGKEYELGGTIETVVSEFQENTGSIAFRARFPNPTHLLKHGATGKVRLTSELENALMLPQKAVFEIQDKNYVYVLDSTNKVRMRNFTPRARLDDYYVVETGIEEGERIVYEGIQNIREGMEVLPKLITPDSLSAQRFN